MPLWPSAAAAGAPADTTPHLSEGTQARPAADAAADDHKATGGLSDLDTLNSRATAYKDNSPQLKTKEQ